MSDVINGVPRELLERLEHVTRNLAPHLKCHADLTALLTAQPQASAAQSAPAGELEAFDKWFRAEQLIADHIDTAFISSAFLPYKAFQAGAAWQRTQSAGVPEEFICESKPLERLLNATAMLLETPSHDSASYWAGCLADVEAMLATAPAQPAAQNQGEVQRLREALENIQRRASNMMDDELFDLCDAALAASTGREVES
jgi:hypothetical protein